MGGKYDIIYPMFMTIHIACVFAALATISNTSELASALLSDDIDRNFSLTGTVASVHSYSGEIIVEDSSCAVWIDAPDLRECFPGDFVRATGITTRNVTGGTYARCLSLEKLARHPPPVPVEVDFAKLNSGAFDNRFVRATGDIRNVTIDEIDPRCILVTLSNGHGCVRIAVTASEPSVKQTFKTLNALIGANISLTGLCTTQNTGFRRLFGRYIGIRDTRSLVVNRQPPADPFSIPILNELKVHTPEEISVQCRRRATGTVIAVYGGNRFIISDDGGAIHNIETSESTLPAYGDRVEVAGIPETDLYRINLSHAIYRQLPKCAVVYAQAAPIPSLGSLFSDSSGRCRIDPSHHGKVIRVSGSILDMSSAIPPKTIILKDGDFSLTVDTSALSGESMRMAVGYTIEVDGICVVDISNLNSLTPSQHAASLVLVPRRQEDIRIIARPSWWTAKRLIPVIGVLTTSLLAFLIWNRILIHIISRRNRQLLKEQITRATSALRVEERTRLAVELHDSLSQNLTGITFQINMADKLADGSQAKLKQRLSFALRTLQSCRNELRDCIHDLRSQALDQHDMNEAIRIALQPHLNDAKLNLRFNVPRARLSDNTTHAILRIIRELATNAICHGHATKIDIAGAIDGNRLMMSVKDNGVGFDPANRLGVRECHFGLQGIAERIQQFNGTMHIDSAPGAGTKVTLSLAHHLATDESEAHT